MGAAVKVFEEGAAKPARGRPRCQEKNQAILDAAIHLFMEKGFDGASMDEIAKRAGVSKQTVYSHFSSKEHLFSEAVRAKIEEHSPEAALAGMATHTLEGDLQAVCHAFFDLFISEDAMNVFRLLTSAAMQGPGLAELFWQSGPEEMLGRLEKFLMSWSKKGALKIDNHERAAMELVSLLKGRHHFQCAIGLINHVSAEEANAHVDECVSSFLKLYRA